MWGLVFVAPVLLPDYPAAALMAGRYLAFGLLAVPLTLIDRREVLTLDANDWWTAVRLSLVGNFAYSLCLAAAVQRAGASLPTMTIGMLPVVIAIVANRQSIIGDGSFSWRELAPALLLIAGGLGCMTLSEWSSLPPSGGERYVQGGILGVAALLCWTWYPIRNAKWLRARPDRSPRAWATAQGLVTLPIALAVMGLVIGAAPGTELWTSEGGFSLGPRPMEYLALVIAMGVLSSWLAGVCWNEASQRLPTALAAQLMVFETLAGLAYSQIQKGSLPAPLNATGAALILLGVCLGLRLQPAPAAKK